MDLFFDKILGTVLTIIGTAFITYRSIKNNRKDKNLAFILDNVYMPLAKITTFNAIDYSQNLQTMNIYLLKTKYIIENNYIYVSKQLLTKVNELEKSIREDNLKASQENYIVTKKYIDLQFDSLRRKCGLPNNGVYFAFANLSLGDKCMFIFFITFALSLIIGSLIFIGYKVYISFTNPNSMEQYERIVWQICSIVVMLYTAYAINRYTSK